MVYVVLVLIGIAITLVVLLNSQHQKRVSTERELRRIDKECIDLEAKLNAAQSRNEELEPLAADLSKQRAALLSELSSLKARFKDVIDVDEERSRVLAKLNYESTHLSSANQQASIQLSDLKAYVARLRAEFAALDEESNLQSFGFYRPHYSFADSERYQRKLEEILDRQKVMLKEKDAAVADQEWTVNGSKKEGQKQLNQTLKLMLRAFNGECDAAIAKVRYNNIHVMEARINKAFEVINSCAEVQQCRITREYLNLKLQELYLSHEYEEKLQAEKEEQRRIKEQMREEEIALREIEKAKQKAEEEENRYAEALERARADVEKAAGAKQDKLNEQIALLEQKLAEAHANKERAMSRAQMTRSGHVYVISNVGSFGEQIYKIGMTRRLEPLDRIKELGDASVPFEFDIHAIIFTEDAPALECKLHNAFQQERVNLVNERKEFFNVSMDKIVKIVKDNCGEVEFTMLAAAEEFRKTQALRDEKKRTPIPMLDPMQPQPVLQSAG